MVEKYGVARENGSGPREDAEAGEGSPLLAGPSTKFDVHSGGNATIVSCVSNLSNTIIGSGEQIIWQYRLVN
jgi:hypothetical protein